MAPSCPVDTATSFIDVYRALDLIFVVLLLETLLPTIYGGISKLVGVIGRVVCSATIRYMDQVYRHSKFNKKA